MSSVYTLIPRPIGEFAGLDMTARYAFGLIYDRWQLSRKKDNRDRYKDKHGIYCVFSREAMAAEMGISLPTLRTALRRLNERGLLRAELPISGGAWRYYLTYKAVKDLESRRDQDGDLFDPDVSLYRDCFENAP